MKVSSATILFSTLSFLSASRAAPSALRGARQGDSGQRKLTRVETFSVSEYDSQWGLGEWQNAATETRGGYYGCGVIARLSQTDGNLDNVERLVWGLNFKSCLWKSWNTQVNTTLYNGYKGAPTSSPDTFTTTMCPKDYYIHGAQTRAPEAGVNNGYTNMVYSGLRILCEHYKTKSQVWMTVFDGVSKSSGYTVTGNWTTPVIFTDGKYAKGGQIDYAQYDETENEYRQGVVGMRIQADILHFGLSVAQVKGSWEYLTYAPNPSFEVTVSTSLTDGSTVSDEQSYGMAQTISAGFEAEFFGTGTSFSVSVGSDQAFATSRAVESTMTTSTEETFSVNCLDTPSPTGYYAIYQWRLEQASDDVGLGFQMNTRHFTCTPSFAKFPKCPLGYCADATCQTCLKPFN